MTPRNRRTEKDEIVVEIGPVQDFARHRVEECLGQFRPLVVDEQPHIEQLRLVPCGVIKRPGAQFAVQPLDRFFHAVVVE
jgi:hypothetical protein